MDAKGEVLITIMASLAQQESQSLSQNVKLDLQFRYQNGQVQVNHNRFLGYTKDAEGHLVIDPAQAEAVKRIYREYLERMQGLRGNQINTWNGQWLAHYFSDHFIEDEPLIGFQPFAAKEDGYEVVTRSWTDVLMAIAREIKDVRMMGYVYSLGQTNITVGFIPFVLTEIRRTVELYIKLFGMRNAKKAEHLFGTAYGFLRSCQMGMIGVSALEPKGLKEYMMKGKIPVYDAENEEKRINFYTYIIWILAMLNNEDLWEKSREIAQMLHTYVLGDKKSNMTRRNQVNKILETNSRMIFLNELQ